MVGFRVVLGRALDLPPDFKIQWPHPRRTPWPISSHCLTVGWRTWSISPRVIFQNRLPLFMLISPSSILKRTPTPHPGQLYLFRKDFLVDSFSSPVFYKLLILRLFSPLRLIHVMDFSITWLPWDVGIYFTKWSSSTLSSLMPVMKLQPEFEVFTLSP